MLNLYKRKKEKRDKILLDIKQLMADRESAFEDVRGENRIDKSFYKRRLLWLFTRLFFINISLSFFRILIILFKDPGTSFDAFFQQGQLESCPYSFCRFRVVHRKIRAFSWIGLFTLVTATVVSTIALNLITNPIAGTFAATYGWVQEGWSGGADINNDATHDSLSGEPESGWTKYYSKTDYIDPDTAPGSLTLTQLSDSWLETASSSFAISSSTDSFYVAGDAIYPQRAAGYACEDANMCVSGVCTLGVCE